MTSDHLIKTNYYFVALNSYIDIISFLVMIFKDFYLFPSAVSLSATLLFFTIYIIQLFKLLVNSFLIIPSAYLLSNFLLFFTIYSIQLFNSVVNTFLRFPSADFLGLLISLLIILYHISSRETSSFYSFPSIPYSSSIWMAWKNCPARNVIFPSPA